MTQPLVTVAVVSWNSRDHLGACLESVRPAFDRGRIAVVVVDNHSSDGSAELLQRQFPWVRLVESDENLGYGRAVNLGLADAETPWLVASNADVEVTSGALDELLRAAEEFSRAGIIAPRLELPDGTTQNSAYGFPRVSATFAAALGVHRLGRRPAEWIQYRRRPQSERPSLVDWVMGAFLLFRRSAFEAIDGFDPEQWMYAEDLDLCWRARHKGWSTLYVPSATIKHIGGASAIEAFGASKGTPEVVGSYYRWLRRRRGRATMALIVATTLGSALVRVLLYAIAAVFSSKIRTVKLPEAWRWLKLNAAVVSGLTRRPRQVPGRGSLTR